MLGLNHSFARSVCLEALEGVHFDDVKTEAKRTANAIGCDVVFILNGKAHLVEPEEVDELVLVGGEC